MPRTTDYSPRNTFLGGSKGFCFFVFLITVGAVYAWGLKKNGIPWAPVDSPYTASIRIRSPGEAASGGQSSTLLPPEPAALREEVLSEGNLRTALEHADSRLPSDGDADLLVAETRQRLRVVTADASKPGELQVAITYEGPNSRFASALVNDLAMNYAQQCRDRLKSESQPAGTTIQTEADQARDRTLQAKARLDAFLSRHFQNRPAEGSPDSQPGAQSNSRSLAIPAADAERVGQPSLGREATMVSNPQWAKLNDELTELRKRVGSRTPDHPEVRDLNIRIAYVEQRLADTPREIQDRPSSFSGLPSILRVPENAPATTNDNPVRPSQPAALTISAAEWNQAAETYRTLVSELAQAIQQEQLLAVAEREARQPPTALPQIDVVPAEVPALNIHWAPWLAPLRSALVAGIVMMVGAALISSGTRRPATFASADEVESALSIPVIGSIQDSSIRDVSRPTTGQTMAGLIAVSIGFLLIAGCMFALTGPVDRLASHLPANWSTALEPVRQVGAQILEKI